MQRLSAARTERAVRIIGALALVVALFGVVIFFDTRSQRDEGRAFLARGIPVVADDVELLIKSGRGGDYIDEVAVVFTTATKLRQHATLIENLGDPAGARPGRRPPQPGTRYAAPLDLLYLPDTQQVIATVDAHFFAEDTLTPRVALGMIAGGIAIATAVLFRHGVPRFPERRQRVPRRPPRHSRSSARPGSRSGSGSARS